MHRLSNDNYQNLMYYRFHPNIIAMQQFLQHGNISTYDHSVHVTTVACKMATKLHFSEKEISNIITGAMLHDFYLYDWHKSKKTNDGLHAWAHPKIALKNAQRVFPLNSKQKNIIRSHMYPVCFFHPPKCKEAWIVTISDKYCAILEYAKRLKQKKR